MRVMLTDLQTTMAESSGARDNIESRAARLNERFRTMPAVERLKALRHEIDGRIVLTTAFGAESQVILHLLVSHAIGAEVVTLDTGRLFPETYALWAETERRYGIRIRGVYPRQDALETLIAEQGIDGFYTSKAARLSCCHVRKVEPLDRALAGAQAWLTGLRGTQSSFRAGMSFALADRARGLVKVNPLFDWARDDVFAFAKAHGVPLNPLHEQGFTSIGCAPCTRAVPPGEPERSGRWWWEADNKTECGLHLPRRAGAVGA
jgi:phosphoadenosine phosphosulfate reductase